MDGMCTGIAPTVPADGMIYVSCDGQMVEIQADNRDDLVNLQLDEQATVKLILALQRAMKVLRKDGVKCGA